MKKSVKFITNTIYLGQPFCDQLSLLFDSIPFTVIFVHEDPEVVHNVGVYWQISKSPDRLQEHDVHFGICRLEHKVRVMHIL